MESQRSIVATNAGELDTLLLGRGDLKKFQMGCQTLENARVLRVGGSHRRAGLGFVAPLADETKQSRLKGFNFSGGQGFALEFSDFTLRVYKNGELVQSGGSPLSVVTPWAEGQVFALDFAQRIDSIVVTHADVPPHVITRVSDTNWTVEEFPWQERIWELATDDVVSMTPGATTGVTSVTAGADLFDVGWEGSRLRLVHVRDEAPITGVASDATDFTSTITMSSAVTPTGSNVRFTLPSPDSYWEAIADYDGPGGDYVPGNNSPEDYPTFFRKGIVAVPPQEVRGAWSFETFDSWRGTYVIERSYNGGVSWEVVKTLTSDNDKNFLVEDEEEQDAGASFRVLITDFDYGTSERFTFIAASVEISGVALVTGYVSPTVVDVTVERDFEEVAATTEWYEDAFSPRNGYPKAVTFYQKRLCFGGSERRKHYIWLSRTKAIYDFTQGTLADDGMSFPLDANEFESVLWLVSHHSLVVGTTSTEWAISSPDGRSITPENNQVTLQSTHGGIEGIPAVTLQNNILFLQRGLRKIRELTGRSVEYGGYLPADLTQLASHITRGGVVQVERGEVPDSTLFVVTGGELAVLTYERSQNVVGWSRWVTDGTIESFGTCNGAGEDDDIYVVVKRGSRRFVEFLAPDMLRVEEDAKEDPSRMADLRFLDSFIVKEDVVGFTVFDGLSHLEGLEIEVFADGEPAGTYTVSGGQVTLPSVVYKAIAGLPFVSIVEPMPLDALVVGSKGTAYDVQVRVRNTLGAKVRQDEEPVSVADWAQPRILTGDPLPLQTGDFQFTPHGRWGNLVSISVVQDTPYPLTVLSVLAKTKNSR